MESDRGGPDRMGLCRERGTRQSIGDAAIHALTATTLHAACLCREAHFIILVHLATTDP